MVEHDDPFQQTRMSLGEHLRELRGRLVKSVIALVVALMVTFTFYDPIFHVLARPMNDVLEDVDRDQRAKYEAILAEEQKADPTILRTKYFKTEDPTDNQLQGDFTISQRMTMVGVGDGMSVLMRICFLSGLALAMPMILWQLWQFIGAGLYPHEKRVVLKYFPIVIGLFVGGLLFGYYVMCPIGFKFMVTVFAPEDVNYIASVEPYLDWLQAVTLALGLLFELPVLMYVLVRVGIVQRKSLAKFRPYFVLVAFVVGGILTPPDPITQFLAAGPMILLYEVGLLWTWFLPKPRDVLGETK
ncbi:MAG: twin-arginine translocase subunit TatC [Planctomycetaceae bacterium]|nr:twin-arginine translocase subunit TatC [Planctomycetaceae bacterium]